MKLGTQTRHAHERGRPVPPMRQHIRRAFTLMELSVALAIVAVALVAIAQLLVTAVHQHRLIARRAAATQEASNVLDRIVARKWGELSAGEVDGVALSPGFLRTTPAARLTAEVAEVPGPPTAKRVRVSVAWTNLVGESEIPVTLFAWKYSEAAAP